MSRRRGPAFARGERNSWFDWWFRSRRTGRITIAQFPNLALWIFLAMVGLRRVVTNDTAPRTVLDWIAAAALGWWALDEVFRGVNPWRRLVGVAGCGLAIAAVLRLL